MSEILIRKFPKNSAGCIRTPVVLCVLPKGRTARQPLAERRKANENDNRNYTAKADTASNKACGILPSVERLDRPASLLRRTDQILL